MTIQQNARALHSQSTDNGTAEWGSSDRRGRHSTQNSKHNSVTATPKPYPYGLNPAEGLVQKASILKKIHTREDNLPALPAYPQRSKSGLGQVI